MKKICALVLSVAMIFSVGISISATTTNVNEVIPYTNIGNNNDDFEIGADEIFGDTNVILGDVNGDGSVNTVDLGILKLHLAGDGQQLSSGADMDNSKVIDIVDLGLLKLKLAGQ